MRPPLNPGDQVVLDCDDSPHGTWRRGETGEVVKAEGRYWHVRIARTGVVMVFDRQELALPSGATP